MVSVEDLGIFTVTKAKDFIVIIREMQRIRHLSDITGYPR
jgi:hypothetical protein